MVDIREESELFSIGNGPQSTSRERTAEALDTGAEILAVSCPVEAAMSADVVKTNNLVKRLQVKEISGIVAARPNGSCSAETFHECSIPAFVRPSACHTNPA